MDIAALGKLAIELGVIPAVALFLVLSMHRQNIRLSKMLESREQQSLEMMKLLVLQIIDIRKLKQGSLK
jgi:hypothetical protein